MRLIFVNYMHPDVLHVSGLRLSYFAKALARRGHQVVLLTRTLTNDDAIKPPMAVSAELETYDWSQPYYLACMPKIRWGLERLRNTRTPKRFRQLLIAWNYLVGEGLFSDWTVGSRPYWPILVDKFHPQIVWGSFGSFDSWTISKGIAEKAGVGWVMDVKDGWENFIPKGLRLVLARRFQGAAAMTSNSSFFAAQSEKWFPHQATVIYSGADACWLKSTGQSSEVFRINLIGSISSDATLRELLKGIVEWVSCLPAIHRNKVTFTYAGGATELVRSVCQSIAGMCEYELHEYLPQEELAILCLNSDVNAYIWSSSTFHHKIVELLCARRPIISYPGEREEARNLAAMVGGRLHACEDEGALATALDDIWNGRAAPEKKICQLRALSWNGQAEKLEKVFEQVINESQCVAA